MDQSASSTALIVSIVAVVIAVLGLVGGVVGYVQGSAALRRAILIRQRAAAAEEAALQARTQAEQSARAAQQALDRLSRLQLRSLTDVADLPTGPLLLASRASTPEGPPSTGPVAVPVEAPVESGVAAPAADEPSGDPADPPVGSTAPPEQPPAPARSARHAGWRGKDGRPAAEPEEERPEEERPEPPAPAARSATGQVTAGLQDAPPMDWAEAIRTGAIPLPNVSRGTYAAPRKRSEQDPTAPVRFELRAVGRQRYEAVNLGAVPAEQAAVEGTGDDRHLVRPAATEPVAVGPGEALAFSVMRVEGRRISVRVSWEREEGRQTSVELPLP